MVFFRNWRRRAAPDSHFRTARRPRHNGVDLNYSGGGNTDLGAPIVATHSGRVARITPLDANNGGGRIVVVSSPDGSFETKYMHLSAVSVQVGDEIDEGQTIGLMGGSAFGNELGRTVHLHYEIHRRNNDGTYSAINPWVNGNLIDPQQWIAPSISPVVQDFNIPSPFPEGITVESLINASLRPPENANTNGNTEAGQREARPQVNPVNNLTPESITPTPTPSPVAPNLIPTPTPNITPGRINPPAPRPDSGNGF